MEILIGVLSVLASFSVFYIASSETVTKVAHKVILTLIALAIAAIALRASYDYVVLELSIRGDLLLASTPEYLQP